MTVRELIEELDKHDGDRVVVLATDAEGNSFWPLNAISTAAYKAEEREIGLEPGELTDKLRADGYTEEDVYDNAQDASVMWP